MYKYAQLKLYECAVLARSFGERCEERWRKNGGKGTDRDGRLAMENEGAGFPLGFLFSPASWFSNPRFTLSLFTPPVRRHDVMTPSPSTASSALPQLQMLIRRLLLWRDRVLFNNAISECYGRFRDANSFPGGSGGCRSLFSRDAEDNWHLMERHWVSFVESPIDFRLIDTG